MRSILTRWLMPAHPSNPASELARIGHRQRREMVKAKARSMREQMGLPDHPALH